MVKQQKVGLASQQLLWDYGLGLRINCPKNNLNISNNKPQPISAGADSTVYTVSGFLNRYMYSKQKPGKYRCIRTSRKHLQHRRGIKAEEKAKVVAAVWDTNFIQFLAALAVLH